MSQTRTARRRAAWWAVALAVVALIPPGAILVMGVQQAWFAMGGGYMADFAAALAPILIALGLLLMAPAVLYLILRRGFLLVVAILVAVAIPLMTLV